MSTSMLLRGFFAMIMSAALVYGIYSKDENERRFDPQSKKHPRYAPYVPGILYPLFLGILLMMNIASFGTRITLQEILLLCYDVFLHICLYYTVLLLMMPLLRKVISARVCAALWMLPNYLYFIHQDSMSADRPLAVIRFPSIAVKVFCFIWFIGFTAVFLWKLLAHLRFRHELLQRSYELLDHNILRIWETEQAAAGFKKHRFRLMRTVGLCSPMSIGFFKRNILVLLPEREYTTEELTLIFRHELVHIGREDSSSKFFMAFCTAMCWFNPLMWIALRRSSEDLELSCDETVLLDSDAKTRRLYAELLLQTAGDDRGFSTCLSASAENMRRRLKSVISPSARLSGSIIAGLFFFVLIFTCGHIALAYDSGTGAEYIFNSNDPAGYLAKRIVLHDDSGRQEDYVAADLPALTAYLSQLRFSQLSGNYDFPEIDTAEDYVGIFFTGPDGAVEVIFGEGILKVTPFHAERFRTYTYLCESEFDYRYLTSLLAPEPVDPAEALPFPPQLMMYFGDDDEPMYAMCKILSITLNGIKQPNLFPHGDSGVGGIAGWNPGTVRFEFSHNLYTGEYNVQVEDWQHENMYHVSIESFEASNTLTLAPYSAHYTVYAQLSAPSGKVYEMEYYFDVEVP